MIYDCPNCRTPQDAGQTVCPHCFAHFDGPVPSDAMVPPPEPLSAVEAGSLRPRPEPPAEASAPSEAQTPLEVPTLTEVPPPASPLLLPPAASSTQPYLTSPSLSPLPYAPADAVPTTSALPQLSRALLIAFPIILVLVLGSVFYANSLNTGSDTVPVPPPTAHAAVPLPPVSAPATAPTVLESEGSTNNPADDPHVKMLAGHWVAASGDFYVFNSDGTGSRGNPVKSRPEQNFLWGLAQNRLMLYQDKSEQLRFSAGPDNSTIFLGPQTGHYVQYSRSKT